MSVTQKKCFFSPDRIPERVVFISKLRDDFFLLLLFKAEEQPSAFQNKAQHTISTANLGTEENHHQYQQAGLANTVWNSLSLRHKTKSWYQKVQLH